MGYTHYWDYEPDKIDDLEEVRNQFDWGVTRILQALREIELGREDGDCIIKGGFGVGKPMINESQVWFNGNANKGMDHETFAIKWCDNATKWNFCKTARKPYDLLVCVALLAFNEAFANYPGVFSYSSDGEEEDWVEAKKLFAKVKD